MNYEELTAALQDKMQAEQDKFKEELLKLSPENILAHAYQYITREDIVLSVNSNFLSVEQLNALLQLDKPLEAVYQQFLSTDVDTLEPFRTSMADLADMELQAAERERTDMEQDIGPDMEPEVAETPDAAARHGAEPERPSILEQLRAGGSHAAPDRAGRPPTPEW